jgi:hypothetical protein
LRSLRLSPGSRLLLASGLLLGLAAGLYVVAAWAVAPGFYDGFGPQAPYRWVSPPPQFKSANQPPLSGQGTARVNSSGVVDAGSVFTQDGQASLSFTPGAFQAPPDHSPVTITIAPEASYPSPGNVHLSTNVYCMASSSPLAPGKDALVTLTFSDQLPAPSSIYEYQGKGPWENIGSTGSAAPFSISARATKLGCFAGGYPANAKQTASGVRVGGGQTLPVVIAIAILAVVLAGIPLAVVRRRSR